LIQSTDYESGGQIFRMASAWRSARVTKICSDLPARASSMAAQRSSRMGWVACPDPGTTGRPSPCNAKRPSLAA